jgi:hypothetical protein
MYRSTTINDDIYYSEIQQKNKRRNLLRIYAFLGIFMFIFFGIATFDIVYWKNECNLPDSVNYFQNMTIKEKENTNTNTNITQIPKSSHQLHCFIFLYGITFYFYLLFMCLTAYSLWCYYSSEDINNETFCQCILSSLSGFARDVLMIIIWSIFVLSVFLRMALFIITIIQYRTCHEYCNTANVMITLIPFTIEFLVNAILLLLGLCFIYLCVC